MNNPEEKFGADSGEDGEGAIEVRVPETGLAQEIVRSGLTGLGVVPDGPVKMHHHYAEIAKNVGIRKTVRKSIVDWFKPMKQSLDDAKRTLLDRERVYLDRIDRDNAVDESRMIEWKREQERLAREEQERLQELAKKKAEEEQLLAALNAEEDGDISMAEAIMDATPAVRQVTVRPIVQVVRGTSFRKTWSAAVIDLRALAKYVADSGMTSLILPNPTALNGLARGTKGASNIPGVRFVETEGIATRTR